MSVRKVGLNKTTRRRSTQKIIKSIIVTPNKDPSRGLGVTRGSLVGRGAGCNNLSVDRYMCMCSLQMHVEC